MEEMDLESEEDEEEVENKVRPSALLSNLLDESSSHSTSTSSFLFSSSPNHNDDPHPTYDGFSPRPTFSRRSTPSPILISPFPVSSSFFPLPSDSTLAATPPLSSGAVVSPSSSASSASSLSSNSASADGSWSSDDLALRTPPSTSANRASPWSKDERAEQLSPSRWDYRSSPASSPSPYKHHQLPSEKFAGYYPPLSVSPRKATPVAYHHPFAAPSVTTRNRPFVNRSPPPSFQKPLSHKRHTHHHQPNVPPLPETTEVVSLRSSRLALSMPPSASSTSSPFCHCASTFSNSTSSRGSHQSSSFVSALPVNSFSTSFSTRSNRSYAKPSTSSSSLGSLTPCRRGAIPEHILVELQEGIGRAI